jgi:hypothetical protein
MMSAIENNYKRVLTSNNHIFPEEVANKHAAELCKTGLKAIDAERITCIEHRIQWQFASGSKRLFPD